ncbi:hypothetical protein COU20_03600 [Candidatus Kaiserbacteria bacterium CG10_big_fil_rev_8_21_14_0_10_59_10]|uniref:DUF8128 domain-containing protein n=1 Tax=Candidatus Kaiserbacteria bacterium CG10_big_fil_rev_8_21_14_0_10_59_10 TaxID=1974612 RepID=A0A2H0U8V7_9BACT|nr:MAG: hypothetical protein COU20_03600 [Candidatus Kaiserbacteria bacterium CG10_big_fil_rev_8_21_14_0_10_59_10]
MAEEEKQSVLDRMIQSFTGWVGRRIDALAKPGKPHGYFDAWVEWIGDWGVSRGLALIVIYVLLFSAASSLVPALPVLVWSWIFATAPIWIPVASIIALTRIWMWYVNTQYLATRKPVLLDIRMPREVTKSPRAMETALSQFYTTSNETTFIMRWWEGKMRPWFSFELASFGGDVHFYLWCWREYKNVLETQLYAQYPEIEIHEAEDYASRFVYDPSVYEVWGNQYAYDKRSDGRDPAPYPIRSYIDLELDKDPKEEFKVDPLAQVIEVFSSLKGSEMAWMQILIRANKESETGFQKLVKAEVEHIRKEASIQPTGEHLEPGEEARRGFPHPTWRQTEQIRALERHASKKTFTVGIRTLYAAKHEEFSGTTRSAIRWVFLPFNSDHLNGLRPGKWHNDFDYPWQDFRNIRWRRQARRFFDAYRRRSYFYTPWITPFFIMSTEALATIYHPPSRTIAAPGLQRIPSTKAEPPPNLPLR